MHKTQVDWFCMHPVLRVLTPALMQKQQAWGIFYNIICVLQSSGFILCVMQCCLL